MPGFYRALFGRMTRPGPFLFIEGRTPQTPLVGLRPPMPCFLPGFYRALFGRMTCARTLRFLQVESMTMNYAGFWEAHRHAETRK